jgi:hypothetical protein
MLTDEAKRGVNSIFTRAVVANLGRNETDSIKVVPISESGLTELPEARIFVLTIASYLFRLMTIFHLHPGKETEDFFTRSNPRLSCNEIFYEVGNLCVGAMNRELGTHFGHIGMSTPYMLESKCLAFIKELKPSYLAQHRIEINESIAMHATLCLCAYAPIDFSVATNASVEATGALELF